MTNTGAISLETIVNVVFGIAACLMSLGGIYATIRAGHTQRYQPLDIECRYQKMGCGDLWFIIPRPSRNSTNAVRLPVAQ